MKTRKLPQEIISRLRSGFSVSSVAQCVNELVLNSLDAKSKNIAVRIDLMTFRIQVVDDGDGISEENLHWIGKRYMTNKCHTLKDLEHISKFYGFKGESLASINEHAEHITVTTKDSNSDITYSKKVGSSEEGIVVANNRPSQGTTVTVENFLFNLPVRRYVVNADLELSLVKTNLEMLSIVHPSVYITLRNNVDKMIVFANKKCESVEAALLSLHPSLKSEKFGALKLTSDIMSIIGLIYKELIDFKAQFIYVNKRPIECKGMHRLINDELMCSKIYRKENRRETFCYLFNFKCANADVSFTQHDGKNFVEFGDWDGVVKFVHKFFVKFLKREGLESEQNDAVVVKEKKVPSLRDVRLSGMGGACKGRVTRRKNEDEMICLETNQTCSAGLKEKGINKTNKSLDIINENKISVMDDSFNSGNINAINNKRNNLRTKQIAGAPLKIDGRGKIAKHKKTLKTNPLLASKFKQFSLHNKEKLTFASTMKHRELAKKLIISASNIDKDVFEKLFLEKTSNAKGSTNPIFVKEIDKKTMLREKNGGENKEQSDQDIVVSNTTVLLKTNVSDHNSQNDIYFGGNNDIENKEYHFFCNQNNFDREISMHKLYARKNKSNFENEKQTFIKPKINILNKPLPSNKSVDTFWNINNQKTGKALIMDKFLKSITHKMREREEKLTSTSVSIKISRKRMSNGKHKTNMISTMSYTQMISLRDDDTFELKNPSQTCERFDDAFQFIENFPVNLNFTKSILKKGHHNNEKKIDNNNERKEEFTFNQNSFVLDNKAQHFVFGKSKQTYGAFHNVRDSISHLDHYNTFNNIKKDECCLNDNKGLKSRQKLYGDVQNQLSLTNIDQHLVKRFSRDCKENILNQITSDSLINDHCSIYNNTNYEFKYLSNEQKMCFNDDYFNRSNQRHILEDHRHPKRDDWKEYFEMMKHFNEIGHSNDVDILPVQIQKHDGEYKLNSNDDKSKSRFYRNLKRNDYFQLKQNAFEEDIMRQNVNSDKIRLVQEENKEKKIIGNNILYPNHYQKQMKIDENKIDNSFDYNVINNFKFSEHLKPIIKNENNPKNHNDNYLFENNDLPYKKYISKEGQTYSQYPIMKKMRNEKLKTINANEYYKNTSENNRVYDSYPFHANGYTTNTSEHFLYENTYQSHNYNINLNASQSRRRDIDKEIVGQNDYNLEDEKVNSFDSKDARDYNRFFKMMRNNIDVETNLTEQSEKHINSLDCLNLNKNYINMPSDEMYGNNNVGKQIKINRFKNCPTYLNDKYSSKNSTNKEADNKSYIPAWIKSEENYEFNQYERGQFKEIINKRSYERDFECLPERQFYNKECNNPFMRCQNTMPIARPKLIKRPDIPENYKDTFFEQNKITNQWMFNNLKIQKIADNNDRHDFEENENNEKCRVARNNRKGQDLNSAFQTRNDETVFKHKDKNIINNARGVKHKELRRIFCENNNHNQITNDIVNDQEEDVHFQMENTQPLIDFNYRNMIYENAKFADFENLNISSHFIKSENCGNMFPKLKKVDELNREAMSNIIKRKSECSRKLRRNKIKKIQYCAHDKSVKRFPKHDFANLQLIRKNSDNVKYMNNEVHSKVKGKVELKKGRNHQDLIRNKNVDNVCAFMKDVECSLKSMNDLKMNKIRNDEKKIKREELFKSKEGIKSDRVRMKNMVKKKMTDKTKRFNRTQYKHNPPIKVMIAKGNKDKVKMSINNNDIIMNVPTPHGLEVSENASNNKADENLKKHNFSKVIDRCNNIKSVIRHKNITKQEFGEEGDKPKLPINVLSNIILKQPEHENKINTFTENNKMDTITDTRLKIIKNKTSKSEKYAAINLNNIPERCILSKESKNECFDKLGNKKILQGNVSERVKIDNNIIDCDNEEEFENKYSSNGNVYKENCDLNLSVYEIEKTLTNQNHEELSNYFYTNKSKSDSKDNTECKSSKEFRFVGFDSNRVFQVAADLPDGIINNYINNQSINKDLSQPTNQTFIIDHQKPVNVEAIKFHQSYENSPVLFNSDNNLKLSLQKFSPLKARTSLFNFCSTEADNDLSTQDVKFNISINVQEMFPTVKSKHSNNVFDLCKDPPSFQNGHNFMNISGTSKFCTNVSLQTVENCNKENVYTLVGNLSKNNLEEGTTTGCELDKSTNDQNTETKFRIINDLNLNTEVNDRSFVEQVIYRELPLKQKTKSLEKSTKNSLPLKNQITTPFLHSNNETISQIKNEITAPHLHSNSQVTNIQVSSPIIDNTVVVPTIKATLETKSDKSTGELVISISQKEKRILLLNEYKATKSKHSYGFDLSDDYNDDEFVEEEKDHDLSNYDCKEIVSKDLCTISEDNPKIELSGKKNDCNISIDCCKEITNADLDGNAYESIDILLDKAIHEIALNKNIQEDDEMNKENCVEKMDTVDRTDSAGVNEHYLEINTLDINLHNDQNDWLQKRDISGKTYLIHRQTGATKYDDFKDSKFIMTERSEFVPKGQSPILMLAEPSTVAMTSSGKIKLYNALAESYKDELGLIKWNKIIVNKDPRKFFNEIYKYLPKTSSLPIISLKDNKVILKKSSHFIGDVVFSKDIFDNVKVIGQLDQKFIVTATQASTLILFDQHALHERIRVEQLYSEYTTKIITDHEQSKFKYKILEQKMDIEVIEDNTVILKKYTAFFDRLGLRYTIPKSCISISTVPLCLYNKAQRDKSSEKLKELVMALIEEQVDVIKITKGISKAIPKVIQNVVNSEACRGAIMFGDSLKKAECVQLVLDLKECNFPFQCAHGRPTLAPIMNMTIEEPKVAPINLKKLC